MGSIELLQNQPLIYLPSCCLRRRMLDGMLCRSLGAQRGLARALVVVTLGRAALAGSTFHPDVGSHCTTDASCRSIMMVCIEGYCDHKQLFPLEFQDYLTTGLIFVAVSIS